MIKHIVIFKLSAPYTSEEKEKSVRKLKEIYGPLGNKFDYIIEYRTGINILEADHAGDFVIDSIFASPEDLRRYQSSDHHRAAVTAASAIRKAKVVIDYVI
ncbi:MAG TPA: Dabb family protein [Bacteroidales bacterium]|nr:Dabb family protein [Bacteroidales bacterium]